MNIDIIIELLKSNMYIVQNVSIGIVSGIISSIIVTKIYRKIDERRDRYEYLTELMRFSNKFQNAVYPIRSTDTSDEDIIKISEDISKIVLPIRKQWIKLTMNEDMICKDFIGFYRDIEYKINTCKTDIQRVQKGEKKHISDVKKDKLELANEIYFQAANYFIEIAELRNRYLNN